MARKLRPPPLNCAAAFYLAPIYTLRWLASVWNESCNKFRSPQINTLDRSVETLSCIRFKSELCQTTDVDIRFTITCYVADGYVVSSIRGTLKFGDTNLLHNLGIISFSITKLLSSSEEEKLQSTWARVLLTLEVSVKEHVKGKVNLGNYEELAYQLLVNSHTCFQFCWTNKSPQSFYFFFLSKVCYFSSTFLANRYKKRRQSARASRFFSRQDIHFSYPDLFQDQVNI